MDLSHVIRDTVIAEQGECVKDGNWCTPHQSSFLSHMDRCGVQDDALGLAEDVSEATTRLIWDRIREMPGVLVDVTPFQDVAPHDIFICVKVADLEDLLRTDHG